MSRLCCCLLVLAAQGCASAPPPIPIPQGADWFFMAAPPLETYVSVRTETHTVGNYQIKETIHESRTSFEGLKVPARPRVSWPITPGHPEVLRGRPELAAGRFRSLEVQP